MKTKYSKSFLATAALIISTLFALALGEVALRLAGFEFALYPTKIQFGWPDPVTLQNHYQVDSELLWVPKSYEAKLNQWKGHRPVAVFMGDSCTEFGRYDEALKSIIAGQNPNSVFSYVNVGVGGWSSYQGLQQLKRDVLPLKPRFITIYYGWNDHWTSFGIEDKDIGKFNLEHPVFLMDVFDNVRIAQLINKVVFTLQQKTSTEDQRRPERVSISDYRSNLNQMVQLAKSNDIIPILITAPSSHKQGREPAYLTRRWLNDLSELVPLHKQYVEAVRDLSTGEGVPLIDLYQEFGRMSQAELDRYFLKDGIHLTPEGNMKIAEIIYRYLANSGMY